MSLIKSDKEINLIRESCRIVSQVLKNIKEYIKEGISTLELDKYAEEFIRSQNAIPAFKGISDKKRIFPATLCVSINEEVVHGIPSSERILKNGDIVSIDVGVLKNGYYGDAAYTYKVGDISSGKKKLLKITEESLYRGIKQAVPGNFVNDISCAVQNYVEGSGFSVVRELVGHGIGKNLHEDPAIPNYFNPQNVFKLEKGMVLAIEPMVNYGKCNVKVKQDGWTVVTKDGEPSAHFEHTICVKENEPEILSISE
jgi:methionyl aminopeptidase